MEREKRVFYLCAILCLSASSAQDTLHSTSETTTESFSFSSFENTEEVTESPSGNEMSAEQKISNPVVFPTAPQEKEEVPSAVEDQPVAAFPENHKNFTPSQYLGDEDFLPHYNHLNPYQKQYENYFEQKQVYNRKPVKFEENSFKNFYFPLWPNSVDSGNEEKKEDFRTTRIPFPYAFEKEKTPEEENQYKNAKHLLVHGHPAEGHVFRGRQENILPYYVFPSNYVHPHEGELHKEETPHFDHRMEKENPWKKVFHVLSALVPLGLLLATLTPNVISVNSTATTKTTTQKRSEDSTPGGFKEEDVLKLMQNYGVNSLSEAECEDRIICELAREGGNNSAGPVQKGFWFLANQTPWDIAEKAGMNDLFKTIKTGNCEVYKCHSKIKSTGRSSLRKKFTRKRKDPK